MAYKKASELLIDVQNDVGLVAGTAVQTYSEPLIYAAIQTIFDLVFRKRFWDHLTDWSQYTLDGVNGLFIDDIDTVCKGFEDIEQIWIEDFARRVVKPASVEHLQVTGADALYYTPIKFTTSVGTDAFFKKVIRFWPNTATNTINIRMRTKPDKFIPTDTVPFPSEIISMGAAWKVLDSDGINPPAAQQAQQLFDLMYRDYVASLAEDVIGHGGGRVNVPLTIRTL